MKKIFFIWMLAMLSIGLHGQGLEQLSDAAIQVRGAGISEAYPNPADGGEAFFDVNIPAGAQEVHITVVNVIGATVWKERLQPGIYTKKLPLSGLNRGVYFYRLEVGAYKSNIHKLIVH